MCWKYFIESADNKEICPVTELAHETLESKINTANTAMHLAEEYFFKHKDDQDDFYDESIVGIVDPKGKITVYAVELRIEPAFYAELKHMPDVLKKCHNCKHLERSYLAVNCQWVRDVGLGNNACGKWEVDGK